VTHFPVIVLIDPLTPEDDIEDVVSDLLAPYDEAIPAPSGEGPGVFRHGSRWDWWVIGGRWNDWVPGNCQPAMKLPSEVTSGIGYIVTPDGEWHEAARPGWFGGVIPDESGKAPEDPSDPRTGWAAKRAEIFSGHRNHLAVCVDCHV
jgi:hypothetical protein